MRIHNLPKIYNTIYPYIISSNLKKDLIPIVVSNTLYQYVHNMKDTFFNSNQKHIDPYEYIYSNIPMKNKAVCLLKSNVSSFYNMIEVYQTFNILEQLPISCKSFHLTHDIESCCSMEAMLHCRDNTLDQYYTAIQSSDFFDTVKVQECYTKHHDSCHIVISNFIYEEEIINSKLLFTQCIYAFACQKKNGSFILKISEIHSQPTIDILYLLSSLYETVYIYKPYTITPLKSDRFIVCINFRLDDTKELVNKMCDVLKSFINTTYPDKYLQCDTPYYYICALQDSNAIIGELQLEYMNISLKYLHDNTHEINETRINNHINKCIQWCKKFNLPYNIF